MHPRLRTTVILALVATVAAPLISVALGFEPAVSVLAIVIVVAFFTVIFMGVIGSLENEPHPQSANDSSAVNSWKNRLGVSTPEAGESSEASS